MISPGRIRVDRCSSRARLYQGFVDFVSMQKHFIIQFSQQIRLLISCGSGRCAHGFMRIPVRLLPPDWTAGLVRSTAGSFSDYVSVSLRRDIFLMAVRGNSETGLEADASSKALYMRPPETNLRQRLKRMQLLIFFICVRPRKLKGNL